MSKKTEKRPQHFRSSDIRCAANETVWPPENCAEQNVKDAQNSENVALAFTKFALKLHARNVTIFNKTKVVCVASKAQY